MKFLLDIRTRIVVMLLILALAGLTIAGYIMNIIAIVHSINGGFSGLLVGRLVGVVVAPLGAVLGLFA